MFNEKIVVKDCNQCTYRGHDFLLSDDMMDEIENRTGEGMISIYNLLDLTIDGYERNGEKILDYIYKNIIGYGYFSNITRENLKDNISKPELSPINEKVFYVCKNVAEDKILITLYYKDNFNSLEAITVDD